MIKKTKICRIRIPESLIFLKPLGNICQKRKAVCMKDIWIVIFPSYATIGIAIGCGIIFCSHIGHCYIYQDQVDTVSEISIILYPIGIIISNIPGSFEEINIFCIVKILRTVL